MSHADLDTERFNEYGDDRMFWRKKKEDKQDTTHEEALEYIFGKTPPGFWRQMLDDGTTPPWPAPKHLKAMGLVFKPNNTITDEEGWSHE